MIVAGVVRSFARCHVKCWVGFFSLFRRCEVSFDKDLCMDLDVRNQVYLGEQKHKHPHASFFLILCCSFEKLPYECISFHQFLSMSNLQLNQSRQIQDGKKYRKCGDVQWMCGSEGKVGRSRQNDGKNLADSEKNGEGAGEKEVK